MNKSKLSYDRCGYLFILPFFIIFFAFIIIPTLTNIFLSFFRFNLTTFKFIWFSNYLYLFEDEYFKKSLLNTGIYTFFSLILTMGLSISLAVILNKKFYLRTIYRSMIYIPHIISMVAASMIWLWLYEPSQGEFNRILSIFGINKIMWLHDVRFALPGLITMGVWKFVGYYMIIFLAGLQTIPEELYESSTIDGANGIQKFFKITIPLLKPVTFFVLVTGLILNFNVFDQILIMTEGGPLSSTTSIVHQIYLRGFFQFSLGYASSMAVISISIIAFITYLFFKFSNQEEFNGVG